MRKSSFSSGFTLIEVVVTMGVFAILVAAAVPTMRLWINNTRVRAVTDALQNGLRQAQAESLRQSRQVVFALTNSTSPQTLPVTATASGQYWVAYTLPSMTDGSETPQLIASGVLATNSSNGITVTGTAASCFNEVGRLINNSTNVTTVTGGATCVVPAGTPPVESFNISSTNADRPLRVNVTLGGQVHMCDPAFVLSTVSPEGCP